MVWIQAGILIVNIIVAMVSYLTLYRHRAIYSIRTAVLRMPQGTTNDVHALKTDHINEELNGGKYTISQIIERYADKDLEIILGQIKK